VNTDHEPKNPVGATDKTFQIVDALKSRGGAGVTELADELGLSKGTVHHHLSTLESHEYVFKQGSQYKLGLRFLELGEHTRQATPLFDVAEAKIDELAEQTGEIANLMIEQHSRGIYLYIAQGENAVKLDTTVGTRQYLHTSASGKAILSQMESHELKRVLERHGLPAETSNTVTSRAEIKEELDEIRERGVAFDGEERAEGIRCVAAPITDATETLHGSVSVTGPSTRIGDERFQTEITEAVRNASNIIGINMRYS
jgi:IclR family acetate operon transcriptional repressor